MWRLVPLMELAALIYLLFCCLCGLFLSADCRKTAAFCVGRWDDCTKSMRRAPMWLGGWLKELNGNGPENWQDDMNDGVVCCFCRGGRPGSLSMSLTGSWVSCDVLVEPLGSTYMYTRHGRGRGRGRSVRWGIWLRFSHLFCVYLPNAKHTPTDWCHFNWQLA